MTILVERAPGRRLDLIEMLRPPLKVPAELPGDRLRLHGFELDIAARELRRSGARRGKRLTVKAQQVLLTLALRPGDVVSREALMDAAWPDSYPTGDVLTQAIVQLRRALNDDADAPHFIETVARSGYRLLGDVAWERRTLGPAVQVSGVSEPAANDPVTPTTTYRPRWRFPRPLAATLALLAWLVACALLWWRSEPSFEQAPSTPTAPTASASARGPLPVVLAASPAFEHSPAPSPDGRLLVFAATPSEEDSSRLHLQSTNEFSARPLTTVRKVWDGMPAWSPDQQWIAFRRLHSLGAESGCEIRLVSVVSGSERLVASCTGRPTGLAYASDGGSLILGGDRDAPAELRGLQRIDLKSGRYEPLPTQLTEHGWDSWPRVSRDGSRILFRRGLMTGDLFTVPIEGGVPEALTNLSADFRGLDWLGDDGAAVFSLANEHGIHLFRLAAPGSAPQPLGIAGSSPQSDASGRRVFFEQSQTRYMLRRWDFKSAALTPVGAMSSSRNDLLPSLAPDGSLVAFYSDRSGEFGLWIADTGSKSQAWRVPGLVPYPRFTPEWSADASHLLVVAEGPQDSGLYEVEAASRRSRRLLVAEQLGAFGYLDTERLLVNRRTATGFRLEMYSRDDGIRLGDAGIEDVGFFQVDASGQRILFARERTQALFSVTFELDGERRVREELLYPALYRAWRVAGAHLWFLRWHSEEDRFGLWRLPLDALGDEPTLVFPLPTKDVLVANLSVLAQGSPTALWLVEQSHPQSDIAMIELPSALAND